MRDECYAYPDGSFIAHLLGTFCPAPKEEEHEDSSAVLRQDQANMKFDALAKSSKAAFEDARDMPTLEDGTAPVEDEHHASDTGFPETLVEGQTSDEDTDDDLVWATQSLLSRPVSTFGGTPASSKPAGRSKAAAARSSKPPLVPSSRASVASSASSKQTPEGPPTQAVPGEGAKVTPKKSSRGRAAISAKLATQGAEQVLGPHGLDEVKALLDDIAKRLTLKPFTTNLRGADHAKYVQEFAEVKKIALSAQRGSCFGHQGQEVEGDPRGRPAALGPAPGHDVSVCGLLHALRRHQQEGQ